MKSWACGWKYCHEFSFPQDLRSTDSTTALHNTDTHNYLSPNPNCTSTHQSAVEERLPMEQLLSTELSVSKTGAQEGTRGQRCLTVLRGLCSALRKKELGQEQMIATADK